MVVVVVVVHPTWPPQQNGKHGECRVMEPELVVRGHLVLMLQPHWWRSWWQRMEVVLLRLSLSTHHWRWTLGEWQAGSMVLRPWAE